MTSTVLRGRRRRRRTSSRAGTPAPGTAGRRCRSTRYGAFAPMGGLFSTVRDLARWVGEFTDAFPPRDDPDGGPPAAPRLAPGAAAAAPGLPAAADVAVVDAPPGVRVGRLRLRARRRGRTRVGAFVGHSGGYPGFGSHMRWHPDIRPRGRRARQRHLRAGVRAGRADPRRRAGRGAPPRTPPRRAARHRRPWPATEAAAADVERLLAGWDDALADRLFAGTWTSTSRCRCGGAADRAARELLGAARRPIPAVRRRARLPGPPRRGGCAAPAAGSGSRSG